MAESRSFVARVSRLAGGVFSGTRRGSKRFRVLFIGGGENLFYGGKAGNPGPYHRPVHGTKIMLNESRDRLGLSRPDIEGGTVEEC